ncbi:MAG: SBBP repeat-containing protein [Gemmatimonadetes bacterium]|nr:SBBP repeat-containing protein [Gemmatimonadota bacterium]
MRLAGGRAPACIEPLDPLPGRSHYLLGNDPRRWRTGVPHYGRVQYRGVYKGIDLIFRGTEGELAYDFIVSPEADPGTIRLRFEGVRGLRLTGAGDLLLETVTGQIVQRRPLLYQETGEGGRREVAGRFALLANKNVGFRVGSYDKTRPLVIDPVLAFSSFLGGSTDDQANAIAVDAAGNSYVTGVTTSMNFPGTARALQDRIAGSSDVFVTKISTKGDRIIYSTYLGGVGPDTGTGIQVDAAGNAYVTGNTASTDFPVTKGAFQTVLGGGSGITDAFVTKLSADGGGLVYSTFLGGTQGETAHGIALDGAGNAHLVGQTFSANFPVTGTAVHPYRGGGDAFVTKLNAAGTGLVFSTFMGGFARDAARGVAVDGAGNVYAVGVTRSDNFPVTGTAIQGSIAGSEDAFLAKFAPDGKTLLYASYLGGAAEEEARGVAVDTTGHIYVAGTTKSLDYPVSTGAYQTIVAGLADVFVTKLTPSANRMVYSTLLGGRGDEECTGMAIDGSGSIYLSGHTTSMDLAGSLGLFQENKGGADGFAAKLSPAGTALDYFTYLGGRETDGANGIAVDPLGNTYITGVTGSRDMLATFGSVQTTYGGGASDAFLVRIGDVAPTPVTVTVSPAAASLYASETQQFTATVTNAPTPAVTWSLNPNLGRITSAGLYTAPSTIPGRQTVMVTARSVADVTSSGVAIVTLLPRTRVSLTPAAVTLTASQTQQFTATVTDTADPTVRWTLTPELGSITSAGLYTAPGVILFQQVVVLTATSAEDPTKSATAVITLVPPGPYFTPAAVTNAASFLATAQAGGVAPGEIVTIFGTRLGPARLATLELTPTGLVSAVLAETRVLFDGSAAPLVYVMESQVSAVVPYAVGTGTRPETEIQVEYRGARSNAVRVPVMASAPGLFTASSTGSGQGAILNEDGTVNSPANPAARGSVVVLFGTGEGQTDPPGADGKPAAPPLPRPRLPVSVTIGGAAVPAGNVLYAGAAPGLVAGVLQVNVRIPATAPSGNAVPVTVTVGTATSQVGVTLAVR